MRRWLYRILRWTTDGLAFLEAAAGVAVLAALFVPSQRARLQELVDAWTETPGGLEIADWHLVAAGLFLLALGAWTWRARPGRYASRGVTLGVTAFHLDDDFTFGGGERRSLVRRLLDRGRNRREFEALLERRLMAGPPDEAPHQTAAPPPAAPRASADREAAEPPVPAEAERFVDLALYRGHYHPGDEPEEAARLDDRQPLPAGRPCSLEVAIRRERRGIAAPEGAPPVINPRKAAETLKVFARVRSLDPELLALDGFQRFDWPYDADSEAAFFRFTPERPTPPGRPARLEVRLYSETLELLELVEIRGIAIAEPGAAADAAAPARHLAWEAGPAEPEAARRHERRALAIHVSAAPGGYACELLLGGEEAPQDPIPLDLTIPTGELEVLLRAVRDFWTELVVGLLATRSQVSAPTYARLLEEMAELGERAWRLLFGNRRGGMAGQAEALGEVVAALSRPGGGARGEIVQVSLAAGAEGFVFPWALLCPPRARGESVDPEAFWGLRFEIEQLRGGRRRNRLEDEPVDVALVLDPGFADAAPHAEALAKLGRAHPGRVALGEPAADGEALFGLLERPRAAHLYYFFCHGYAPGARQAMARDALKALTERIEALPEGSPERAAWETWLTRTQYMGDEAMLFFGTAELSESRLSRGDFFTRARRPVVFLNMCQSADLLPGMGSGLTRLFLDRNAAAVIGTECPMTSAFARPFGEAVLELLLEEVTLGDALRRARRRFHEQRNPLGFAYTLYGPADVGFGPEPAPDEPARTATPTTAAHPASAKSAA